MQLSIAHNAVTAKLVSADRNAKLAARDALSYLVDGAQYIQPGWDGRSSFFDWERETFPAGFVYLVYKALLIKGYKVRLVRKPFPEPLGAERPVVDGFGDDPRYEYQHDVARALLRHGQVIAQIATGGGKSRIARICYKRIDRPTLFLTTRGILAHQMKDAVEKNLREPVSMIGDGHPWPERPTKFVVGMVQTLSQAIELQDPVIELDRFFKNRVAAEDRQAIELLEKLQKQRTKLMEKGDFSLTEALIAQKITTLRESIRRTYEPNKTIAERVARNVVEHNAHREKALAFLLTREFNILEEAHESSGQGYYDVMRACPNAHYRLSLTATPFMRDSAEANMRLMACSGPVAVRVTEEQLINLGVLATPYFKFAKLKTKPEGLFKTTAWPRCRELGVVKNDERNAYIVNETKVAISYGLPVLILVTAREHGKILQEKLVAAGVRVNYIFGDHDQAERQAALNALADGRIDCLIGSTILDVGVDVPSIGLVVNAGAGKAEVQIQQRIGRGMRAKKAGPNAMFYLDFEDDFNNTLRDHARGRRQIIDATPGFRERVVSHFDYEGLGFMKKAA